MTDRNPKPSKADRTAAAREQARALREAQKKKERRNKLLVRWGVVVCRPSCVRRAWRHVPVRIR